MIEVPFFNSKSLSLSSLQGSHQEDQIFIDNQGTISINFGAYGVPETFLVNEDKKVLKKYIGPLNDEDVNEIKNITNN